MILMASPVAILFIFVILIGCISVSPTNFVINTCGSNGYYKSNSIYSKNLDSALANLSSAANTSNSGFYNASVGKDSDRVNALVLCRGDFQPDICRSCVKDSGKKLRKMCPDQKEAVAWFDECMLRYSNFSVLNNLVKLVDETPTSYINLNNASDMVQFNEDLRDLLDDLRGQAIQRKFATGKKRGPDFQTIFGLMQCTPDLSSTQCGDCLDAVIGYISSTCSGKIGGQVMNPSCSLRFEIYRFYDETITVDASPPRTQLPPLLSVPPPGKIFHANSNYNCCFDCWLCYAPACFDFHLQKKAKAEDMASLVLMLNSSSLTLAEPSEPAFFMHSSIDPEVPLSEDQFIQV